MRILVFLFLLSFALATPPCPLQRSARQTELGTTHLGECIAMDNGTVMAVDSTSGRIYFYSVNETEGSLTLINRVDLSFAPLATCTMRGSIALVSTGSSNFLHALAFNGSLWLLDGTLDSPSGFTTTLYGNALAVYGDIAAVSEPGFNSNIGRVYIFQRFSPMNWGVTLTMDPAFPIALGLFGSSLAMTRDLLAIGEPRATNPTGPLTQAGLVSVYDRFNIFGTDWSLDATSFGGTVGARLGTFPSVASDVAFVTLAFGTTTLSIFKQQRPFNTTAHQTLPLNATLLCLATSTVNAGQYRLFVGESTTPARVFEYNSTDGLSFDFFSSFSAITSANEGFGSACAAYGRCVVVTAFVGDYFELLCEPERDACGTCGGTSTSCVTTGGSGTTWMPPTRSDALSLRPFPLLLALLVILCSAPE